MPTIRVRWREAGHPNPLPESIPAAVEGLDADLAVPDHPTFEHLAEHAARPLFGVGRTLAKSATSFELVLMTTCW